MGHFGHKYLADVTGLEVKVPVVKEATALGVAMAAGIGAGVYKSFEEAGKNIVKMERIIQPNIDQFSNLSRS